MLVIHSVQKLLNTSHLQASDYVSSVEASHVLQNWYARLLSSGFSGKMMVLYVHEPSLMTIICKGKTIQGTWKLFSMRLEDLLGRHDFPQSFVKNEIFQCEKYLVAKTKSRSILAHMNQMVFELEFSCRRYGSYESIALDPLEDGIMERPYKIGSGIHDYITPIEYWRRAIAFG